MTVAFHQSLQVGLSVQLIALSPTKAYTSVNSLSEDELHSSYNDMENGKLQPLHDSIFNIIESGVEKTAQLMSIQGMRGYTDINGHNVLIIATRIGNLDVVRYLINVLNMSPTKGSVTDGSNALHWSVIKDQQHIAHWMLCQGADPTIQDNVGNNLAHYAACCGRIDIIKYLAKDCNMDMTIKNRKGRDARRWAREKNRFNIMQFLLEYAEGVDDVTCSASESDSTSNSGYSVYSCRRQECSSDSEEGDTVLDRILPTKLML